MNASLRKKLLKTLTVNREFVPFKAHYFLYEAGTDAVLSVLPLIGKSLGISVTAFSVVSSMKAFMNIVVKLTMGPLVDYTKQIKLILSLLILIVTATRLGLLFIPPLPPHQKITLKMGCTEGSPEISGKYNDTCLFETLKSDSVICRTDCGVCYPLSDAGTKAANLSVSPCDRLCRTEVNQTTFHSEFAVNLTTTFTGALNAQVFRATTRDVESVICKCESPTNFSLSLVTVTEHCFNTAQVTEQDTNDYVTLTFWLFFIFLVLADGFDGAVVCLGDAGCYEKLDDKPELYGRQRLWGIVGIALTSSFIGYVNDLLTGTSTKPNFTFGFIFMTAMNCLDFFAILKADLRVEKYSANIFKDVGKLLKKIKIVAYLTSVFLVGCFSIVQGDYLLWYLEELGCTPLLIGLMSTVKCCTEIPSFFFANYVVVKLGCITTITVTFLAFSVRCTGYYFLKDPWWVLPIELTNGITFALFYCAATLYSKSVAPPGTEATMQSLTGATYDGLGRVVGSLLSGVAYKRFGGKITFGACAVFSLVSAILNALVHYFQKDDKSSICKSLKVFGSSI